MVDSGLILTDGARMLLHNTFNESVQVVAARELHWGDLVTDSHYYLLTEWHLFKFSFKY
jgi:hypothetical protein